MENKVYRCKDQLFEFKFPIVMGIINCTPDSFYSGSRYLNEDDAVAAALNMWEQGAAIIDIGGTSTRPGALAPTESEELQRVIPVIEKLKTKENNIKISIDTWRHQVAKAAVEAGACMINDISAGSMDPKMWDLVAQLQVPYVIMHMQGTPETMQIDPHYDDVLYELIQYFFNLKSELNQRGVYDLILDPGFGFGKLLEHNYTLLFHLDSFVSLDLPVMAGLSRKSLIYNPLGKKPEDILTVNAALHWEALQKGAHILRVHDVAETVSIVRLFKETKRWR